MELYQEILYDLLSTKNRDQCTLEIREDIVKGTRCQIMLTMGESEELLNNYIAVFMESYEDTCCNLVCDMESIHGKLVGKTAQLLQKLQQSCKTLKIQMPRCGKKQLSLCQERQQLEKKIEEYEKLIKVRVDELNKLRKKHNYLWNKMLDLEKSTLGPERYNDRGGKLLKEEKERNKLSKQIPQIEETLNRLAEMYELRCGHPFLTFGETVQEYIINLHQDKENMKKQKLSARKMMKEQTMLTPAKSAISLFPSTSQLTTATPITTEKNPRIVSGKTNSAKVRTVAVPDTDSVACCHNGASEFLKSCRTAATFARAVRFYLQVSHECVPCHRPDYSMYPRKFA